MRFLSIIVTLLTLSCLASAQSDSVRVIRSVLTDSPTVDGILEEDWWNVPASSGFTQREPEEGAPSTEQTDIRVMHSPSAIFVAFRCYEQDASLIESTLNKRDRIWNSDRVVFWLDTYHDHRNAFVFGTNPHGVKFDGTFYNDSWEDEAWDGYWEVATAVDDSGWVAEFMIPLSTLRFKENSEEQTWGFNAFRYILRNKEMSYWQAVLRDKHERVSELGHLEGLIGLKPGSGLEVRPYAVANFVEEGLSPLQGDNDWENLGVDIKYRLASNLTLDAAFNPDFAQIEADDEVINLSDYPVYLTEKRPFFMEGAELYETHYELFYSRRITNPQAGAKVSGKIDNTQISVITARNVNEDDEYEDFGVMRLKKDIFSRSEMGFLFTDKEGPEDDFARVWSVDGQFHIGERYKFGAQVAQSFKPGLTDNNLAYHLDFNYSSDKYSGSAWVNGMGKNFRGNDAGWISYTDYHRTGGWFQYAPRPEKWGIRRFWNNVNGGLETQVGGRYNERWCNYNNSFQTMNYLYFGFGASYSETWRRNYVEEDEDEPYEHTDNFGNYNMENYKGGWRWIWFETDFSKPWAFGINHSQGDFRDGFAREYYTTVQVRPKDNLTLNLQEGYERVQGVSDINDGDLTNYFVGRFKMEWTLTLRLFTRLNLQYVHEDNEYYTNALIGYQFAPESYFYLVYDDSRSKLLGWDSVRDRKIKMKVSYFVQI